MRIESGETATAAQTSYELLAPARYVSVAPTWREFLMADAFPEPEKPNPAVMPKDDKERRIWREAVREAWSQGLAEADQLYADNISRMVRQYRGLMLYHLLTAQHLLSKVNTATIPKHADTVEAMPYGVRLLLAARLADTLTAGGFDPAPESLRIDSVTSVTVDTPRYDALVYRNVSSTAGLASYAHRIGE